MQCEVFIQADWNNYAKEFTYSARAYLSSAAILVEKRMLEFESPVEAELRKKAYTILMEQKATVLADAQVEAMALQQQADELLALEDLMKAKPATLKSVFT